MTSLRLDDRAAVGQRLAPRFIVFGIAIVLAVTGLGVRLFQLQVAQGSVIEERSEQQLTTTRPIPWHAA